MSSAADWATAIRCSNILARGHHRAIPEDEPTLLVQRVAQNPVVCGGSTEHFSQRMPIWVPKTPDEDSLFPIDFLYGHYDPATRSIEIFVNRIRQDAKNFDAEEDELPEIVRIHEHAHAVAHVGSRADDVHEHLSAFAGSEKTAWSPFIEKRTLWFKRFPTGLHEFVAQALTYAALSHLSTARRSERMREVFETLEVKQPPHYKLSPSVKQYAGGADWSLVLDAAREAIDVYRQQDFELGAGLEALVCAGAQ